MSEINDFEQISKALAVDYTLLVELTATLSSRKVKNTIVLTYVYSLEVLWWSLDPQKES